MDHSLWTTYGVVAVVVMFGVAQRTSMPRNVFGEPSSAQWVFATIAGLTWPLWLPICFVLWLVD